MYDRRTLLPIRVVCEFSAIPFRSNVCNSRFSIAMFNLDLHNHLLALTPSSTASRGTGAGGIFPRCLIFENFRLCHVFFIYTNTSLDAYLT